MKKVIVLVLTLILFSNTICLAAERETFNYKDYSGLPNYKYDAFDKEWSAYGTYSKKYKDAFVVIGLQVGGTKEAITDIELYCWIRDEKNREVIYEVKGIDIMIGETIYSWKNLMVGETGSSVMLGENTKPFIEAVSKADKMAIRLNTKTSNMTYELDKSDCQPIRVIASGIIKNSAWKFINEDDLSYFTLSDALWPMEIDE